METKTVDYNDNCEEPDLYEFIKKLRIEKQQLQDKMDSMKKELDFLRKQLASLKQN